VVEYLENVETYREDSILFFVGAALSAWGVTHFTTVITR